MEKSSHLYNLSITGSNISSLITKLVHNGVTIYNACRDKNSLFFSVSEKDYVIIKSLDLDLYKVVVESKGGKYYLRNKLLYNMGIILGLIVSIVLYAIVSNKIFYIKVMGLKNIEYSVVESSLNSIGIKVFSNKPSDTSYIVKHLEGEFDFSMVSVITKGNAIIINVKEELDNINNNYNDIVAGFDMVIKDIVVYSGSAAVEKGDIVRNGDTLVYSYNMLGDNKEQVVPKAKIVATRFISQSYRFYNEEKIMVRTGSSKVIGCDYYLGNKVVYSRENEHGFVDYEVVHKKEQISNYFMPISIDRTVVYELRGETIKRDFDAEKNDIFSSLKNECLSESEGLNILSEKESVIKVDNGYVVNYYIETEVYLDY